ncbi:hypothetical protein [Nocardia sp. NPDC004604]|uniref:hypothetical protein n=1 Tax=Nocardia sp. NPDC004604 TaxID=3157013 RepID=UPI0033AA0A96
MQPAGVVDRDDDREPAALASHRDTHLDQTGSDRLPQRRAHRADRSDFGDLATPRHLYRLGGHRGPQPRREHVLDLGEPLRTREFDHGRGNRSRIHINHHIRTFLVL